MTIQMIAAASCVLSKNNVRRTASSAESLAELKADIAARGVLQNLIGFAIPKKRGKFEITAGGRRLSSVHALIADGALPADYQVPVFVMNDTTQAAETSLAENFQRQAMNPCDECNAFRYFIEAEGKTIEDVARRFGLTTRFVEGRIRLSGLAEEIFEALRAGEIGLEVAQAFGTTSDVARQSAVYAQSKNGYYGFNPGNIRRAMINETITASNPVAKLVGREAYVAAGGRVETDLFGAADDEIWLDSDLVRTLGEAKMTEAAAGLAGYGSVVPVLGVRVGYDDTAALWPVQGEPIEPSEAEAARLAEIATELEAIEATAAETGDEDYTPEQETRIEALEAEAEAITNRVAPIDDATKASATVFLVIGPDGTPTLHETVYVDRQRDTAPGTSSGNTSAGKPDATPGGLGQTLRDELAVQRTKLLGLHLANDAGMAVDLAVFLLADAQVSQGRCYDRGSSLSGSAPSRAQFGYKPEGQAIDQLQAFSDNLDHSWAEHRSTGARFDAFRALDDDRRGAWAGWVVARTLEPKLSNEMGCDFHNHLGRSLGIDVAAWWRPTAANFFNRVKKDVALNALRDIGGDELRARYINTKKSDLAAAAEKLCAGGAIVEAEVRAKAIAWVPDVMTFAATGEAELVNETDRVNDDEAPNNDLDDDEDVDPVDDCDNDTLAESRIDALDEAA